MRIIVAREGGIVETTPQRGEGKWVERPAPERRQSEIERHPAYDRDSGQNYRGGLRDAAGRSPYGLL